MAKKSEPSQSSPPTQAEPAATGGTDFMRSPGFSDNPRVKEVIELTEAQIKQYAVEGSPAVYEEIGWYRSRAMGFRDFDSMAEVQVELKITEDKMLYCRVVRNNFLLWAVYLGQPNQWKFSGPGLVFTQVGGQTFKFAQNPFVVYLSPHLSVPYIGVFYMFKGFSKRKKLQAFLNTLG